MLYAFLCVVCLYNKDVFSLCMCDIRYNKANDEEEEEKEEEEEEEDSLKIKHGL